MKEATETYLRYLKAQADMMRERILSTETNVSYCGKAYYVSADGCDENDGLTEDTPWKTLKKTSEAELCEGDAVFFRRGDIFRGQLMAKTGVTYSAYGTGKKPALYGGDKNYAGAENWECVNEDAHIWKMKDEIMDTGTLVFNDGKTCAVKLVPSFIGGKFVLRNDNSKDFVLENEATEDLMFHQACVKELRDGAPVLSPDNTGFVYLRCDKGNPGEIYRSIEVLPRRNTIHVGRSNNVTIDNLCIRYCGSHGVGAGTVDGLTVKNCEIGWIGGGIQHYNNGNPARRGIVTRYGNGVEIYGGCHNYTVDNCWFYQVYDAAITHQVDASGRYLEMYDIAYTNNLIETSSYSIEYFLSFRDADVNKSRMKNIRIADNFMVDSGRGWGKQRYNPETPSHIKSWNSRNPADHYVIENNVFFGCAYDLLQIGCVNREGVPVMRHNTYVQKRGASFGNVGCNPNVEHVPFCDAIDTYIRERLGDRDAVILYTE